tara:strand:- start:28 stop:246 length:219 start_codon:yes stop_codon:yes gene_type:complete
LPFLAGRFGGDGRSRAQKNPSRRISHAAKGIGDGAAKAQAHPIPEELVTRDNRHDPRHPNDACDPFNRDGNA